MLAKCIDHAAEDDTVFTSDVGTPSVWAARYLTMNGQRRLLGSFNHGSMANALSQALGAQSAFPKRQIVAMCGDGGFLMNIQELETAVRLCLPLIVIIWCDYDYGMISFKQIHEFGRSAFTKFNNPNFAKLAESFGAIGYNIKSTKEFSLVLKEAVKSKSIPVIISVDVDYSRNRVLLDDSFVI